MDVEEEIILDNALNEGSNNQDH
ncbi:hypothetical protein A2U01_0058449, partial [Trifolium medium]|nr:hypothetical protein [Trifolium medium]